VSRRSHAAGGAGSSRQLAQRANDRGLQLYKEKQYAQAEAQFTEALKLRPNFALAANNLGFVFFKQDKSCGGGALVRECVKMDPSRAIAYMNLGDAHAKAGDGEKAKRPSAPTWSWRPRGRARAMRSSSLKRAESWTPKKRGQVLNLPPFFVGPPINDRRPVLRNYLLPAAFTSALASALTAVVSSLALALSAPVETFTESTLALASTFGGSGFGVCLDAGLFSLGVGLGLACRRRPWRPLRL
jgi:tetratricopeptide (TPR) repeat protein